MIVTFDHSEAQSATIATFYFKPERPLAYTAGQFVELTLKHKHPDERGEKRWFTLSSAPTQDLLSITTKFVEQHSSSFKRALQTLQPGDEFLLSDPMGDFVLPKLIQTPLTFIAGGIGVTPFHSILQWLADTAEVRPITMIIGVHDESDIVFQDLYERAGQHVTIIVNEPSDAWGGLHGQLTAERILGIEQPAEDALVYVSGPEQMVETLSKDLRNAGIKKSQIVGDYFPGYQTI